MTAVKFDIQRDKRLPCFCLGCLTGKKRSQMSQRDIRYCVECQPIIEYEYSLSADKGSWKRYKPVKSVVNLGTIEPRNADMGTHEEKTKLLPINENSVIVNNFRPRGRSKTYKKQELPEELIKQLYGEGLGLKAIASRLKREQGIEVSHMTISRVLSGERTGWQQLRSEGAEVSFMTIYRAIKKKWWKPSYEKTWQKHLEGKLGLKPVMDNGFGGKEYELPKKMIKPPRAPRRLSESAKKKLAEWLHGNRVLSTQNLVPVGK